MAVCSGSSGDNDGVNELVIKPFAKRDNNKKKKR